MTLTEFLLARIAEKQAEADRFVEAGAVRLMAGYDVVYDANYVRADCEAKRRIVEWHSDGHYCTDAGNMESWYLPDNPCPTVRALALPDAGHPDYREGWKP